MATAPHPRSTASHMRLDEGVRVCHEGRGQWRKVHRAVVSRAEFTDVHEELEMQVFPLSELLGGQVGLLQ